VVLHRFESLVHLDGVVHGVTTRAGGVSTGPFASLNLGLHVGDEPEAVLENRRRACRALEVEAGSLVAGAQVLGSAVAWATGADRGRGALDPASALPGTDALITDSPGVTLVAFSADCPLVALVDPLRRAIGLAHASRRGLLGHVVARTVRAMERLLGCEPSGLLAAIAPSVGPCCYEVGDEVFQAARQALPGAERYFTRRGGRQHLDLWAATAEQLTEAGVLPQRIEQAGLCTCCHADEFFSYRAAQGPTGRFALFLGLTA
jgi:YfiH family protein